MKVLVDAPIWRLAFSRKADQNSPHVLTIRKLITQNRARLIGPIRQAVLTGIRHENQFARVERELSHFVDEPLFANDFIRAAEMYNTCRAEGSSGDHLNFLICAVAERLDLEIYTSDKDFEHYAKHLPIRLLAGT